MLEQPLAIGAGDKNRPAVHIEAGIKHRCRDRAGRRNKTLDLLRPPTAPFEPCCQFLHVFVSAAREGAHQVGNNVLFLACLIRQLGELFDKSVPSLKRRFPHQTQHFFRQVFRRDFQLPAGEFARQRLHVFVRFHGQIVANAAGDADVFDAVNICGCAQEFDLFFLAGLKIAAAFRVETGLPFAYTRVANALGVPHIGGRAADIGDCAFPIRAFGCFFHFPQQRFAAARLHRPALMAGK